MFGVGDSEVVVAKLGSAEQRRLEVGENVGLESLGREVAEGDVAGCNGGKRSAVGKEDGDGEVG